MRSHCIEARAHTRHAQRGAAMVEAAVIMPVVLLFYGIFAFVYDRYTVQETLMAEARYQAFSGSLHQCPGTADAAKANDGIPAYWGANDVGHVRQVVEAEQLPSFIKEGSVVATANQDRMASNAQLSAVVRTQPVKLSSRVFCVPRSYSQLVGDNASVNSVVRRGEANLGRAAMSDLLAALFRAVR